MYNWSLRWAEADVTAGKNPKAYADHLTRVLDLQKYFQVRNAAGINRDVIVLGTKYYVAEAKRLAGEK